MAIQVGGTQVISNSQGLTNIASIDSTTAASIQAAGVGTAATTPTLSGDSALTTFSNTYTLTVSNFSSYTVPLFFYSITNNGGTLTGTGQFTASSVSIDLTEFSGTGPFSIKVIAGDSGKAFSAAATKSVSDVAGISAQYWEIGVTPNEGIAEWNLYSGRNATGTSFSVTSYLGNYEYSITYGRSKAHDGDGSTMWWSIGGSSGQGSNTLIFNLGSQQTVKSMTFANFSDGATYQMGTATTAGCTVRSSTNASTWTNRITGVKTNDAVYTAASPKVFGT